MTSRPPAGDAPVPRPAGRSMVVDLLGLGDEPPYPVGKSAGLPDRPWGVGLSVLTMIGALLVGFLLVAGLSAGRTSAVEKDERKGELIELIEARQAHTATLTEELEALRAEVDAVKDQAAGDRTAFDRQLSEMEAAAGLTAVAGPGVRVTLEDAADDCSTDESDCRIHDTDLQLALNTLFTAGAEAVAINGERVIATTAIRRAGRQVLVNYGVLHSPYVIEAVGNPERLELELLRSPFGQDFTVWKDVFGLGFEVERDEELLLPHHSGSVGLETARPAEPATTEPATPAAGSGS